MGASVDVAQFNWYSRRARHARYGRSLRPWIILLTLASIILFVLGIFNLIVMLAFGWVLLGLGVLPLMVVLWYQRELRLVPRVPTGTSVDDRMDSELLSLLSPHPTPKELALALMNVNGGLFFDVRFGVGGGFLKEVASDSVEDTKAIFTEAFALSEQFEGRISPGVLILAMFRQIQARDSVLGHLQLSESDLLRGIKWYHHLDEMIQEKGTRSKQQGGIGRDWSFGWIPLLSRFGQNISQSSSVSRGEVRTETLRQLTTTLDSGRGSIALVGKDGVGKTELVYELAHRLMNPTHDTPKALWYQQVFMLDASRLLSVANERGALEELVSAIMGEAYAAKNIIVCFDNAELFFQDGIGSINLSTLLQPIIEAGRLRLLFTIDEQNYLQLSKKTPGLANALTRITVQPTDEAETLRVLQDHLPYVEYKQKVTYMYQALKEAYVLSQRYIYDQAMPGQAITLLEQAANYAENKLVTVRSVNRAIEQTTGIKTAAADDTEERETLLQMESLIHQRMIGQDRAVGVVSDALRRARSGIRNRNRPVGTFLFLGPTGVGKTELAKSLAEVYFGGEGSVIRLDMNEFVSPSDVARLIADGAEDQGSLTAQVMRQPFSVVLLDEIEKAHSSVLTTLLQLLDEGILRDVRGREVSFRDAVVIATSNAGSDRIQEYINRGYGLQEFEETFISELINSHIFHPEFLNRFDEMVVFGPLSKQELLQVVDLILVGVNKNLSEQKITITVAQDAKEYLVDAGYDPRLGARPMRRVVQKAVENTVAKLLLSGSITPGSTVEITLEQVESILGSHREAAKIAGREAGL